VVLDGAGERLREQQEAEDEQPDQLGRRDEARDEGGGAPGADEGFR
jgi:hypothetical protein